jgi:threonine dehydratase
MVSLEDVRAAAQRIQPYIVRTPIERSAYLSEHCRAEVWLKYECFQLTGSFKLRGALNALLLSRAARVLTVSAGNHGLGVARAAHMLGLNATVVVPETASPAKIEALQTSGAELVVRGATYDDAERIGRELAQQRNVQFLSPYNDPGVIAGGGTVALEILEDLPETTTIVVPVGGGGLSSGVGVAAHGVNTGVTVIGAQSDASPALQAALHAGRLVPVPVLDSLADGLAGNVEEGSITFDLVREHLREIVLVTEAEVAAAMRSIIEREHVLVEGSAAVGVAALHNRSLVPDGPTAVILSGRNVAAAVLQQYVFNHD